ncbi:zinc finger protein 62 homolog isoform X6 [Stomoxys calcitrans]|uniref:zinc finger protein 62 homolog isoform X6 n=1 Tax=Stomoxys calcitrans TaxID=35570 RepID=UPI0027E239C7|nr:zinc finger protein 62 homolog isoform X6 [Stomoxys calcitrans]
MVKCILCLEYPTIPGPKFLDVFSEEGTRLGISAIINKHFWIKTYRNGDEVQRVCMTCWEVVRDFHILYERVEEVHKHLGISTIDISDDPLPHQDVVMLKSEDTPVPMILQDPIMGHSGLGDNLFDPEVKVEVNDLDLLPQIEIIETETDLVEGSPLDNSGEKKPRRGRPSTREQSPKTTAAKRIKKESSPALQDSDDDGNNVDVFADSEPIADDGDTDGADNSLVPTSLEVPEEEEAKEKEVRPKRGRPRKSDAEKAKAASTPAVKKTPATRKYKTKKSLAATIKNEGDDSEEPSCSTSAAAGVSGIKTEKPVDEQSEAEKAKAKEAGTENPSAADPSESFDIPSFANDDDDDDDQEFLDNDFAGGKDSDDSSNSDSDEANESETSDWEADKSKNEKFAIILKKERNTPKKYKKREKTASEPKRMSKEDIAARQAQQAEYDNIITKFFEKLRCPKCELLVHTFSDMRAHFRLDHNDDHGFVECCGRRFATRKFLAEHIMVHYNPEHFKCKTCDKICRDSTQLESHEQTHLPNPPEAKYKKTFQCEKCSKTFSSKASFEHHMVAKHVPREEFKFECPECKKKFPTSERLNRHLKLHNPEKLFVCDQCGKTFPDLSRLKLHNRHEHFNEPKPERVPQQCVYCGKWYSSASSIYKHLRNIHANNDVEHRCHICGFVSTTATALKKHIQFNHEMVRKYKCTVCEKAFKRPQDLKVYIHIYIYKEAFHRNILLLSSTPFGGFLLFLFLQEHMATHTGEALYSCVNCGTTFKSKANMFHHRRRFHKSEWALDCTKPPPPPPLPVKVEQTDFPTQI